jgi:FkbM family methyltransferase
MGFHSPLWNFGTIHPVTTLQKLALARMASRMVCAARRLAGLKSRIVCRRGGIHWDLDLGEGFDFAIYLFGSFEPEVANACRRLCPEGGIFLDVGANIGAHTLPLAALAGPQGQVHAFEPTRFAFRKLSRNISLNPELSGRIEASQVFLGDSLSQPMPEKVPAAWPLRVEPGLDPQHGGRPESLTGCRRDTLDDWMERMNPARIDLLKLDVDGHEIEVLRGAERLLQKHRPKMIVEFAPYVFSDKPGGFQGLVELLGDHGYEARTLKGKALPLDSSLAAMIPSGSGVNAVLTFRFGSSSTG